MLFHTAFIAKGSYTVTIFTILLCENREELKIFYNIEDKVGLDGCAGNVRMLGESNGKSPRRMRKSEYSLMLMELTCSFSVLLFSILLC